MPKHKNPSEVYNSCLGEGKVQRLTEVNPLKLRSLIVNAEVNLSSAQKLSTTLIPTDKEWMNVFTLHYEALRMYPEVLLYIEKVNSSNHYCLFAGLSVLYTHLELDWSFLERVRAKRHGLNYYGETFSFSDWKSVELQLNLYISALQKEVQRRLP